MERVSIFFDGLDLDIYAALKEAAADNRRDVSTEEALYKSVRAEVLCILERAMQDRIWCIRKPSV